MATFEDANASVVTLGTTTCVNERSHTTSQPVLFSLQSEGITT